MNLTVSNTFKSIALVNLVVLGLLAASYIALVRQENQIQEMYITKYQSYLLADELRHTSGDLTRLAFTYTGSGESKYEQQYRDILDIRSGKKPRPKDYHRVYWDLYTVDMQKPRPDEKAVPLQQLMEEAGFIEDEFRLLEESNNNSVQLNALETEAMQATKGRFRDVNGNYTIEDTPNPQLGVELLLSETYHKYKADRLKPLDKFIEHVETRTASSIKSMKNTANTLLSIAMGLMIFALIVFVISGFIIARRVVKPVGALTESVSEITEKNNLDVKIPYLDNTDEIGELAGSLEVFREKSVEERERLATEQQAAILEREQERLEREKESAERKHEANISQEIANVINACEQGDFSQRLTTNDKDGVLLSICKSINNLSEVSQQSLGEIKTTVQLLSEGDLTRTVQGNYNGLFGEMKEAVNDTIYKLQQITGEIRETAENVGDSASEISSASSDLSGRTESQASMLEETAASMEEITATVQQNTSNASELRTFSNDSKMIAANGADVVKQVVVSMGEISQSSGQISEIIGVIDEIAFQINLLALNAAVEAARAGEAGKGFAVVADEVRTLAGRSAKASKEIKDLIQSSVEQVQNGETLVNKAGESLDAIVDSFNTLATKVAGIADASEEQAAGVAEVNNAVTNMDKATQQNAAMVEQSTASAISLSQMANSLNELVSFFKVTRSTIQSSANFANTKPLRKHVVNQ